MTAMTSGYCLTSAFILSGSSLSNAAVVIPPLRITTAAGSAPLLQARECQHKPIPKADTAAKQVFYLERRRWWWWWWWRLLRRYSRDQTPLGACEQTYQQHKETEEAKEANNSGAALSAAGANLRNALSRYSCRLAC